MRVLRPFLIGCVGLVCLGLSACGSDPSEAERVSLSYDQSPINELLGVDIALRPGDLVEMERAAERSIVECMLAAGFEYQAIDFASQFAPDQGIEDPDSRAYAQANGYGISIGPAIDGPDPQDFVDPNEEVRAGLSDSELQAYQLALYGQGPVDGEPLAPGERTGCVAHAYESVYAAQAELGQVEQFFGEFAAELVDLEARFRADPRFLELQDQWAACMAEAGFAVATRSEIFVELDRRMSEVGPLLVQGAEPAPEVQEQMDVVSDFEREIAVADWDCTQPVQDEMQALRYGYEALFLEDNQDLISDG